MREIEFRAWLKKEKKMVDLEMISFNNDGVIIVGKGTSKLRVFLFNQIELMQYTGIMDTNGVKVFEGDIVYVNGDDIGVIEYKSGCFYVRSNGYEGTFYDNYFGCDVEVIGNIYENKELLNE